MLCSIATAGMTAHYSVLKTDMQMNDQRIPVGKIAHSYLRAADVVSVKARILSKLIPSDPSYEPSYLTKLLVG